MLALYSALSACTPSTTEQLFDALLGPASSYEPRTRPNAILQVNSTVRPPPEIIDFQLQLTNVFEVDDAKETMTVDFLLRTTWNDPRLVFNSTEQGGCWPPEEWIGFEAGALRHVWKPDVYLENTADMKVWKDAVWLRADGQVWHTTKQKHELHCRYDFSKMPYDVQNCAARFDTLRDSSDEVRFRFLDGEGARANPLIDELASPIDWTFVGVGSSFTHASHSWYDSSLARSVILVNVTLRRHPAYYESYVLHPLYCLVACGWLSFFIDPAAAPARIGVTAISFLAILNFIGQLTGRLPRISGTMWLLSLLKISQVFNFAAIAQFALVNYLWRLEQRIKEAIEQRRSTIQHESDLNRTTRLLLSASHAGHKEAGGPRRRPKDSKGLRRGPKAAQPPSMAMEGRESPWKAVDGVCRLEVEAVVVDETDADQADQGGGAAAGGRGGGAAAENAPPPQLAAHRWLDDQLYQAELSVAQVDDVSMRAAAGAEGDAGNADTAGVATDESENTQLAARAALDQFETGATIWLNPRTGHLWFRHTHLDQIARVVYPLAYCIVLAVFLNDRQQAHPKH